MFFEQFPTLVSEYSHARRDLAFIGDFNFHFEDSSNGDIDQLKTLLNDHDLVQLMDMPTYEWGHVLDWVIVRHDASCLSLGTVEDIALSDHSAIYCSVNVGQPTARKQLVTSHNLRAMNSADFQADIKSFTETAGDQCADLGLLDVYDTSLRQVLDRHAPLTTRRVSDCPSAPWMTDGIKAAKHELRQAERQWRDTRLTVHREIYTKQWGVVKTLVRAAWKLHFSARIENCSNTKQFFSVSSGLLGKSKTTPLPSDIPRSALQDRFCVFFSQKIQNIQQDLDAHPSEPAIFSGYDGPKLCLFQPVTEEEICKFIVESPTKTCMLDPIPTSLTKECLADLLPLITRTVNSSLCSGAIPLQFKQAVVTPLLKEPGLDPNDLKNFWPVSNLLFISKIQEKVVLTQLWKHLSENNLLEIRQPAYWKNHSTETALLSVVDGLLRNADDRLVSVLALLDLSAAFDTLDHPILLQRLETTFGISGTAFWFAFYLEGREQSVKVDNILSSPSPLQFGVPQGSVLGPILFTLYSLPLSDLICHHECEYHKYADVKEGSSQSISVSSLWYPDLHWMSCRLDVQQQAQTKCRKDQRSSRCITSHLSSVGRDNVDIGGKRIQFRSSVRNLGVHLDQTLSMQQHISNVCRAAWLLQFHPCRITLEADFTLTESPKQRWKTCS